MPVTFLFLAQIFLRRAAKLVVKRAVKGSHRGKAGLKRTVGRVVLALLHKKYRVFKSYYSDVFYKRHVKARFEIAGYVALAISEVLGHVAGGNTAFVVLAYVEKYLR